MSAPSDPDVRTLKPKKPAAHAPLLSNPGHSGPTTFFLRSEKELEKSMQQGEDRSGEDSPSLPSENASMTASVADTSFGVTSLEDAMSAALDSTTLPVRADPNDASGSSAPNSPAGRKRKVGNPVHPKIYAAGQRIVSHEQMPTQTSAPSPASLKSIDSPFRSTQRRGSVSSSVHLTPLRMSPQPESTLPGTPRSNSVRSFRLSDEEASIASDTGSQAIQSSSGEEEDAELSMPAVSGPEPEPRLVMPSIAMPTRRPFTQRGRNMGRMRIMVAGACGLGKTSLIRNIFRVCEDIVHVDGLTGSTPSQSTATTKSSGLSATTQICETHASTKPYPLWWSEMEASRSWWRRKSFGEAVLERNLCFVDTAGIDSDAMALHISKEVDTLYRQAALLDNLNDAQLLGLLSGESDCYLDAVLYLFDPTASSVPEYEINLLQRLSTRTNVIPLIARSDVDEGTVAQDGRERLASILSTSNIEWCSLMTSNPSQSTQDDAPISDIEPFAISSLADDGDIMDASTLMASDYLPPLAPSDLKDFVDALFNPTTIARLRHLSAKKFLSWRRDHLSQNPTLTKQNLLAARPPLESPAVTSTGSLLDDPSKVLVPRGHTSYYPSTTPSASDASGPIFDASSSSAYALTHPNDANPSSAPRHLHVANWARDLQRSLRRDPSASPRPPKGRLGGDLAVIDPADPLGILALTHACASRGSRSAAVLRLLGGCGVLGVAVWCVVRAWPEVQDWLVWPDFGLGLGFNVGGGGAGGAGYHVPPIAVPAPTRGWFEGGRFG